MKRPPNFLVILGEGHGWTSLPLPLDPSRPARADSPKMPRFEGLMREGMRLARFYAPSPRCTPSRAALLTGKSPAALRMTFVGEGRRDGLVGNTRMVPPATIAELPEREVTYAELLAQRGWATAHFGKWHVGRAAPDRHGFATHDGANHNGGPDDSDDPSPVQTPRTARLGAAFLAAQAKAEKPFLLQISQYASREDAAQTAFDDALGLLLDTLAEHRVADDTYVIYTTDHGSPGRNLPLRGGKGFLSEGGIRVPLLVRGPGIAPGSVGRTPATGVDLLPTIAELAGAPLPPGLEGGSLAPLLRSRGDAPVRRSREGLFFHFPHYDHDNGGPQSAVIVGDGKLLRYDETGRRALYDLARDPGERDDRSAAEPARAADLEKRLDDYLQAVDAARARPNPNFDPNKPSDTDPKRGGGRRR